MSSLERRLEKLERDLTPTEQSAIPHAVLDEALAGCAKIAGCDALGQSWSLSSVPYLAPRRVGPGLV